MIIYDHTIIESERSSLSNVNSQHPGLLLFLVSETLLEYSGLSICSLEGPLYEKATGHADENRHCAVSHVANANLAATEGNPSAGLALNGRMRLTGVFTDATLSDYWTPMSMFPLKG